MQIEIVCFGVMREYLPSTAAGNSARVELNDGATVAEAVASLGAPERAVHAILVNEEPSDLGRQLEHGDRLTLMPHYSGGGI